jgi:cytochrome c biogenesis protein ResB
MIKEGASSFAYNISMNQPLRHAGLTFFQSSFGNTKDGKSLSVLQVVRNPSWTMPYIACTLMTLGLLIQFGIHLFAFIAKRRKLAAPTAV